jgi:hypothetical protein
MIRVSCSIAATRILPSWPTISVPLTRPKAASNEEHARTIAIQRIGSAA